jgi:hypothetical protein
MERLYFWFWRKCLGWRKSVRGCRRRSSVTTSYSGGGEYRTDLWQRIEENDEWLDWVITEDEGLVLQHDSGIKRESKQWKSLGSPRLKNTRMSKSKVKKLLICFFDCHIPALYSRSPSFKSEHGDWLFWQVIRNFSQSLLENARIIPQITPRTLPCTSFPIQYSLIVLPFELLTT